MVWGFIGYHGVDNLVILVENVNAANYVKTLSENLHDSVSSSGVVVGAQARLAS